MKVELGDLLIHLPSGRKGWLMAKVKEADGKHLEIDTPYEGKCMGLRMIQCQERIRDYKKAFKRLGPPRRS
jgi:hypothetical protein